MGTTPLGRSEALRRVAEALNETLDADAAIAALLPELEGVLGLRTAWAFRYRPERGDFVKIAATGLPPALAADHQRALEAAGCECQRRFHAGQLTGAVNMVTCSRLRDAMGDKEGLVLHASVPLRRGDHTLGILNVAAPGQAHFDQESLALLSAVGNQFAVALGRAESQAAAERRAGQLAALADVATALAAEGDPPTILRLAVSLGVSRLGIPCLAVLREPGGEVLARDARSPAARPSPRTADGLAGLLPGSRAAVRHAVSEQEDLLAGTPEPRFDPADLAVFEAFAALLRSVLAAARRQEDLRRAAVVDERQRIAADLHDAVSQRLFAAILGLRTARLAAGKSPDASLRQLETAEEQLRTAQAELRTLAHTLLWQAPRDLGAALRDLVHAFSVGGGPKLTARIGSVPELSPQAAQAVLRIAQEALHNAVRHAGAAHIRLSFVLRRGEVVLRVQDDGCGLPAHVRRGAGFGSMQARADAAGGRLTIHGAAAQGVLVELRLALAQGGSGT